MAATNPNIPTTSYTQSGLSGDFVVQGLQCQQGATANICRTQNNSTPNTDAEISSVLSRLHSLLVVPEYQPPLMNERAYQKALELSRVEMELKQKSNTILQSLFEDEGSDQLTSEGDAARPAPSASSNSDPTTHPAFAPTVDPTVDPTADPTVDPTREPTEPTADPTTDPTFPPTTDLTAHPTADPKPKPTTETTFDPTADTTVDSTADALDPTQLKANPTIAPTSDSSINCLRSTLLDKLEKSMFKSPGIVVRSQNLEGRKKKNKKRPISEIGETPHDSWGRWDQQRKRK